MLIGSRKVKAEDLYLYKSKPILIENRRWDFVTGSLSQFMGVSYDLVASLGPFWRNSQKLRKARDRQRSLAIKGGPSTAEGTEAYSSKDTWRMIGASPMSLPHFTGVAVKGFVVELPVAMTEGFRNTPRLHGEKVAEHPPVTDWNSGITVAGTTFARQMAEGLTNILVQPAKGAQKDGVVGFSKGLGKGTLQTLTKPAAGKYTLSSRLDSSAYARSRPGSVFLATQVKASTSLYTP